MATGVYIVYRNADTKQECTRVGPSAVCFCGHGLGAHAGPDGGRCGGGPKFSFATPNPAGGGGGSSATVLERKRSESGDEACKPCAAAAAAPCACRRFVFVPRRPEEVGEWWLPRRRGFNVHGWRAKCRCGHGHDEHDPSNRQCVAAGCAGCAAFSSAFCCVVCEARWEAHETVAEDEQERRTAGRPTREHSFPLADSPNLRSLVYGGDGGGGGGVNMACTRRAGCPCSVCSSSSVAVAEERGQGGSSYLPIGRGPRPPNPLPPRRPERSALRMDARAGGWGSETGAGRGRGRRER